VPALFCGCNWNISVSNGSIIFGGSTAKKQRDFDQAQHLPSMKVVKGKAKAIFGPVLWPQREQEETGELDGPSKLVMRS
jgi:hypothetical protein